MRTRAAAPGHRSRILAGMAGLAGLVVLTAGPSPALAAEPPTRVVLLGSDLFSAGRSVLVPQNVAGDALLAGQRVNVLGSVGGDLVAAGGDLQLDGAVSHNLFAAARTLALAGTVAGNARLAAGELHVLPSARIDGGASLAAGRIDFDGQTRGYLSVAAAETQINGHIGGDAHIVGNSLELGPLAVIDGSLEFRGPAPPTIAPAARIAGGVHFIEQRGGRATPFAARLRAGAWLGLLGWMIAGAVLLTLWPAFSRRATETTYAHVGTALLLGIAVLIAAPVVILMLLITVIGAPLALLLLGAYLLLLPLGYLTAAATLSDHFGPRALATPARRAWMLAAALLVLFVITRIPVLGGLLKFLLLLAGIGGLVLTAQRARTS